MGIFNKRISINYYVKGSATIIAVIVVGFISFVCLHLFKISSNNIKLMEAYNISAQAAEYANVKSSFLDYVEYSDLVSQKKREIINSDGYFDEVIVGSEVESPNYANVYQRKCIINIYKGDENSPRFTKEFIKLSAVIDSGVPKGTVFPWYGDISNIPYGFALADGSNGTKNLTDYFLVAAGSKYSLGNTGGLKEVQLTADENVSHYHGIGDYHQGNNSGTFLGLNRNETFLLPPGGGVIGWNGKGHGFGYSAAESLVGEQVTSIAIGVNASKPHENRPPYFAVYYIEKI